MSTAVTKPATSGGELVRHGTANFVYLSRNAQPEPRVGIFMKGGCDLHSLFVMEPLLRQQFSGTCCLFAHGTGISDARPDILLQTRAELPAFVVADVVGSAEGAREGHSDTSPVSLPLDYFRPALFERTFALPDYEHLGSFPKTVVVLSLGPAVVRSAYRHRVHGYLVDPGGFWLNESMEKFLADAAAAKWFRDTFESAGWMSVEEFYESFGEVVRLVKAETGARVLVFNALVVDPKNPLHNYQFVSRSQSFRRRQFDVALRDLSRELDFFILDVDKILKLADVSKQIEFSHFPKEYMKPVTLEAYRILRELEVF